MDDDARMLAVQVSSSVLDWDPDIFCAGDVQQVCHLIFGCGVPCRNCRWDGIEPQLEAPVRCTGCASV